MPTATQIVADWTDACSEAPAAQLATVAYGTASATGRYLVRGNELAITDSGINQGERSTITVPLASFTGDNLPAPGKRVTVAGIARTLLSRRIRAGALLDLTIGDTYS
jgi:hypothetical protein